jgi:hypothetical protein
MTQHTKHEERVCANKVSLFQHLMNLFRGYNVILNQEYN